VPHAFNRTTSAAYKRGGSFLLLKPNVNQGTYERIGLIKSTTSLQGNMVDLSKPPFTPKRTVIIE
jgi:hypothetical protein